METSIRLFVPGRLCLFGEHSDWAGLYKTFNADIVNGSAIVSGTEQGIYAVAEKDDKFVLCSNENTGNEYWECEMVSSELNKVAQQGGFFSYVAGVASYVNDNYIVSGVKISITKMDLPMKCGLSSSAAICVLVARAFNQLYHLNMNIKGEMNAAFRGEQRTASRCGRLDQACAYGVKPVLMHFNGFEVDSKEIKVGATFHWVVTNLMSEKDTIKILSDLSKAYPFANNDIERKIQEALGEDNRRIVSKAVNYIEEGNAVELGNLMNEAQALFDEKVAPASSELAAPVLHRVLNDRYIKTLIYGAKGVGSQGDGSVQFLVKGEEESDLLRKYLSDAYGMPSVVLTLKPKQIVKKAIIPLAGFGTRLFPATKCFSKCFMPVLDSDGNLKPALMIMLEQLVDSGIEEICLIIGESDQKEFDRFFSCLSEEHRAKLPKEKLDLEDKIIQMSRHITYVYQKERKGFGHAVWLAKEFANGEPVLLLLGDFLYRSFTDKTCCEQIIDAYQEYGLTMVSISEISLDKLHNYGILHGSWIDDNEKILNVDRMVEKPSKEYALVNLGVDSGNDHKKYYATFGQYILRPEVFSELEREINNESFSEDHEYGLTSALDSVREKYGMYAVVPEGKSYDIGIPEAYLETMCEYYKTSKDVKTS